MESVLHAKNEKVSDDTMIELRFAPEQLVDFYSEDIYKLCVRLTFSKEDAEDLFQDTFMKAIEQLGKVNAAENPRSFLYSITVFLWKSKKRKYARRQKQAPTVPLDMEIASSENVEAQMIVREQEEMVREVVKGLPDKLRLPIILHYTGDLSVIETAKALKIPSGTVKSRLHKARKVIEEEMEKKGYGK